MSSFEENTWKVGFFQLEDALDLFKLKFTRLLQVKNALVGNQGCIQNLSFLQKGFLKWEDCEEAFPSTGSNEAYSPEIYSTPTPSYFGIGMINVESKLLMRLHLLKFLEEMTSSNVPEKDRKMAFCSEEVVQRGSTVNYPK